MLYKCKHGTIVANGGYCPKCNQKPTTTKPGQSFGNKK